ncbi:MAG: hypothetical protein H7832_11205 [Magnetococcus sp. DMHC-6]
MKSPPEKPSIVRHKSDNPYTSDRQSTQAGQALLQRLHTPNTKTENNNPLPLPAASPAIPPFHFPADIGEIPSWLNLTDLRKKEDLDRAMDKIQSAVAKGNLSREQGRALAAQLGKLRLEIQKQPSRSQKRG